LLWLEENLLWLHLAGSAQVFSHYRCPCIPPRSCLPAGVPPLERSYAERYGGQPQYEAYKASTNLLFPWPPRDKFP
jgi:hypothetical protein